MALTSVPLVARERWWTRLAKLPVRLWSISGDLATMITDGSPRRPSKRKLALIPIAMLPIVVVISPSTVFVRSRVQDTPAFDALHARGREIWETSPSEALALLRSTFEQLVAGGAFAKMKAVEIAPFGRFQILDVFSLHRFLYDCEVALGNFEQALAVAAAFPGRLDDNILRQVDCLVALDRRAEAIALLERNLDLDGWRGKLRRRLGELGGHLRALS